MSKYLISNCPVFYELFKEKLLPGIEQEVIQLNKETEILYFTKMLEQMELKQGI